MSCQSESSIDIQGHRGCRGLLPENSLPAFEKAIELGVHTLELDLAITKDNEVIVSHEPYMNPEICLKPNGEEIPDSDGEDYNLYQMSFDSIKQFDCGSKPHPRFVEQNLQKVYKPLLAEVFDMSETLNADIKYNIEIKAEPKYDGIYTPDPETFVGLVLDVIKDHNVFERTNLQSFDVRILEEIKKQAPNMKVALLVDEDETIAHKLTKLSYKPEIISPYFKLLNKVTVKGYIAQGFQIIPWTANETEDIQRMIDYKVNGIITDYPDRLIALLEK